MHSHPTSARCLRSPAPAWFTYAHTSVLTSGEILEGCSMQSCKAGKRTLLLAYCWRQRRFNPHFPLAFPSAQPLSSAEAPGDAGTVFGDPVQAGRGERWLPAPLPGEGAAKLPEVDCVRSVLQTHEAVKYANAFRQAASCLLGSHNQSMTEIRCGKEQD